MRDNGRGIPVDPHPKFQGQIARSRSSSPPCIPAANSRGKAYATSGGLHGVGCSVVNALSYQPRRRSGARAAALHAELRPRHAAGRAADAGAGAEPPRHHHPFHPDPEIFGVRCSRRRRLYRLCRSKAYLFRGVRDPLGLRTQPAYGRRIRTPRQAELHFPGGLRDSWKPDSATQPPRAAGDLGRRGRLPTPTSAGTRRMGRAPGSRTAKASSTPIAIPSLPRRAARMRAGFAPPC